MNGNPVEVKTKQIYRPSFRSNYDNAVCAHNCRQKGTYAFFRLLLDQRNPQDATGGYLWFCGAWDCATFKATDHGAEFLARGQTKPGFNGWRVKASCYNRKMGACRDWDWFVEQLRTEGDIDPAAIAGAAAAATEGQAQKDKSSSEQPARVRIGEEEKKKK